MFKKFLELLERIAIALETIAKIEYTPKSIDHEITALEPTEEVEDEEIKARRLEAETLLETNPTNQQWAEDNLNDEQLESLE